MVDTRLRRLERAASQGDVEARARVLCERLRAGDLAEERVRLAAYLGDPGARLLLAERAPELPVIRARAGLELNQRRWITGLRAYGKEWLVLAAVALAHARFAAWTRWDETDERPRRAVAAAEAWVRCPCDAHLADAAETVAPAERAVQGLRARTARSAYYALRAARVVVEPNYRVLGLEYEPAQDAEALRQALRAELVPWLVGHADPVAARG